MAEITADMVKKLRESTGCGMMDCKKALQESGGDMEKANEYLRERGLAQAQKKASRATTEGLVDAYIHGNGRLGVLVEVNCETDFVAKNEEFKQFVRDIAMQVAASNPQYVSRDDIPEEQLEKERNILRAQAQHEGKPEHIVEKMIEGRLDKYLKEICLLEQEYIKDTEKTVNELVTDMVAKLGENISIRRFERFVVGEGKEAAEEE